MPEILENKKRIAKKQHKCSYCGEAIEKGYTYDYQKLVHDGYLYEWKNHIECGVIASELWNYVDPNEGMTEEDFKEGCRDFCDTFICPSCNKYDDEYGGCKDGKRYCIDKISETLKTNSFKRVKKDRDWTEKWILELKKVKINEEKNNEKL
jgi:hypothetical protein